MKTISMWAVKRNLDQTEGRGPCVPVVYTESEELAKRLVQLPFFWKKYGVMGCPPYENGKYDVEKVHLTVVMSIADYLQWEKSDLAKSGLAKLTPEECDALGLS